MSEDCLARDDELVAVHKHSSASYTTRASELTGNVPNQPVVAPGSRRDFLQALQLLDSKLNFRHVRFKRNRFEVVPLHLSCPHDTWIRVFGEMRGAETRDTAADNSGVQVWEHHCSDGAVTCIGYLFERSPGVSWVVVVRVCLPRMAA